MVKADLLSLLTKSEFPVSVQEILTKIHANKTTIYRELDSFVKKGLVNEIEFGDGKKRYELADKKHHHHIICKICGKVSDIEVDEQLLIASLHTKDFAIENHNLEFFGKCHNCSRK